MAMPAWWLTGFVGLLFFQGCLSVLVEVTPKEITVLPGMNVTYLCRVGEAIQYCRIAIPGEQTLNLNPNLRTSGGISYYGAGLQAGQCGVTIDRVKDINNGVIKCFLGIVTEPQESNGEMRLTVAKAPRAPQLEVSTGTDALKIYRAGDVMRAYCTVRDGRPVASLSWYLDDMPITEGLTIPTVTDMAKEELYTIEQNLTHNLVYSDNGKSLRCVAEHPAYQSVNNVATRQLDVKYPPLPLPNPIDKFGYKIGDMGSIEVDIEANPKPHIQWSVRGETIKEGQSDITGRINAELQDLGRGHHKAILKIAAISKQDTETQYILTAYNDMGSQDYTILISTSPEPEGLRLETGAIIGIIVAILILILIVFIIVFARVTGRWCFSGRSRRSMAESSDTESVEVRQKEQKKSILPSLKIPPLFKRNKDKEDMETEDPNSGVTEEVKIPIEETETQTTQETTPTPTSTPTEGVKEGGGGLVYAELDLVSGNVRPVVKSEEDKTEYAEIVYAKNDGKEPEKTADKDNTKTTS